MATLAVISISTPIFLYVILPIAVLYYFVQRFYVSRLQFSPVYTNFIMLETTFFSFSFRLPHRASWSDWNLFRDPRFTRISVKALPALKPFEHILFNRGKQASRSSRWLWKLTKREGSLIASCRVLDEIFEGSSEHWRCWQFFKCKTCWNENLEASRFSERWKYLNS